MPKKILQKESLILRKISRELEVPEIKSPKIQKIINEMRASLDSQVDGVAVAAPQIGYLLRIFIVSSRVREIIKNSKKVGEKIEVQRIDKPSTGKDMVFINPEIKKLSKQSVFLEEGCLSVRYLYGKVKRSKQVTVQAIDENGNKFIRGATGLLAQIFQHEIDHLDGILFTDKAKDIVDIPPEELNKKDE